MKPPIFNLRRFSDWLKAGSQLFIFFAGTVIGIGLILMLRETLSRRAPLSWMYLKRRPALAQRGLSGRVVAGGLLDGLARLQAATHSTETARDVANAWTDEIKVEIPETGLSVGEVDRLLKSRFVHERHIGGDLVQAEGGGLNLTVRGPGVLAKSFNGGGADLEKLTVQAAEYVYGQSLPGLYVTYLGNAGRDAEAIAEARQLCDTAPLDQRPFTLEAWANALVNTATDEAFHQALTLYKAALAQKPDYWVGYYNLMNDLESLGDEEGAWRIGEDMRRIAGGRPGRAPEAIYGNWDLLTYNLLAARDADIADADSHRGYGTQSNAAD